MTNVVAGTAALCALVLFLAGMWELSVSWIDAAKTRKAVHEAARAATSDESTDQLRPQAADLRGTWEGLAALASALKDLDRSSRLFVLSLVFLGGATLLLGVDSLSSAIGQ